MVDNVSVIPFIQAAPRSHKRINAKRTGRLARRYAAAGVRTIDDSVIVCYWKCSERRARSLVGSRAYSGTVIIRDAPHNTILCDDSHDNTLWLGCLVIYYSIFYSKLELLLTPRHHWQIASEDHVVDV